jgi:hypothetical protein
MSGSKKKQTFIGDMNSRETFIHGKTARGKKFYWDILGLPQDLFIPQQGLDFPLEWWVSTGFEVDQYGGKTSELAFWVYWVSGRITGTVCT